MPFGLHLKGEVGLQSVCTLHPSQFDHVTYDHLQFYTLSTRPDAESSKPSNGPFVASI